MLSCNDVRDSLSSWMDGELAPPRVERVESHLAACAACREVAGELRELDRLLLDVPPVPGDPGLAARLCDEVFPRSPSADERPGFSARVVPLPPPPLALPHRAYRFAVTAAAFAVVVFALLRGRTSVEIATREPPPSARPHSRVAQQMHDEMARVGRELAALETEVRAFKARSAAEAQRSNHAVVSRSVETWK